MSHFSFCYENTIVIHCSCNPTIYIEKYSYMLVFSLLLRMRTLTKLIFNHNLDVCIFRTSMSHARNLLQYLLQKILFCFSFLCYTPLIPRKEHSPCLTSLPPTNPLSGSSPWSVTTMPCWGFGSPVRHTLWKDSQTHARRLTHPFLPKPSVGLMAIFPAVCPTLLPHCRLWGLPFAGWYAIS